MANLDDFFAKKDKKKKSKKGFSKANADVLAKNLEEQDRKEAKAEEKIPVVLATSEANKAQAASHQRDKQAEEEWKDYDETAPDYSNLKIEALKVESGEEEQEEEEHEINEDGEKVLVKKSDGGPWNKTQQQEAASVDENQDGDQARQTQREREKAELESSIGAPKGSVVGGSYVPPHMRGSQSTPSSGNTVTATRGGPRKTKHVPDMNSEIYFPSLSAAGAPSDQHPSERDFEEVKSSGGSSQHTSSRAQEAPRLALDNKFAALRN